MIWKTCRKCFRELELWSDDIEDSDPFWCNFCTEAEHAGRTSIGRILYPDVSYTMANNLPHLTIRWTQPLCVSSHINWKQMFYISFSLIRMVIKFEFICGRSLKHRQWIIRHNHFVKSSGSNFNHMEYFYWCSGTIIHCVVHVQMSWKSAWIHILIQSPCVFISLIIQWHQTMYFMIILVHKIHFKIHSINSCHKKSILVTRNHFLWTHMWTMGEIE